MTTAIIPAAAGYFGLWPPGSVNGFGRSPIVGWCVSTDEDEVSWTRPIIEGEASATVTAILCPDGTVNGSDSGDYWVTLEDWVRQTGLSA